MRHSVFAALSAGLLALPSTVNAQSATPRFTGYGAIAPQSRDVPRADASIQYRAVFNVTKAAASPDKVNPSLDKVARLLNLLARDNIRPAPGDIVVIVHGAATPIIANSRAYGLKTSASINPNLDLISKLQAAGVTVAVCSQALTGNRIASSQLAPGIRLDLSAMTTLVALQSRGWALIPD